MRLNAAPHKPVTAEGAPADFITPEQQLERLVMACFLWEDSFYLNGKSITQAIEEIVPKADAKFVESLIYKTKKDRLKHVPLLLMVELLKHPQRKSTSTQLRHIVSFVCDRPDFMGELLALYWRNGKCPISAQLKRGLQLAFKHFSEYQLSKWNRDAKIKLRDILLLVHPHPVQDERSAVWKRVLENKLEVADTRETRLSKGEGAQKAYSELLAQKKLGYTALIKNLKTMHEENVDEVLIRTAILEGASKSKLLPFEFLKAMKYAPAFQAELDTAMVSSVANLPKLPGATALLIDVSGSMDHSMSGTVRSYRRKDGKMHTEQPLMRSEVAGALAIMAREMCSKGRIFTFSSLLTEVPAYKGIALQLAISGSQPHGSTYLGRAVNEILNQCMPDRLIVITDEQSHDSVQTSFAGMKAYCINVGTSLNGLSYRGDWVHIDGFSPLTLQYIQKLESEKAEDFTPGHDEEEQD